HPATDDGCETDTTTPTNCGDCNVKCAAVNSQQSTSTCRFVPDGGAATCQYSCTAPFDDCNKAVAPATDGCEANLNNDKNHCGGCPNVCDSSNNTGTACSGGTCGYNSCNPNQADCTQTNHNVDECEINANTTSHCGSCNACLPTSSFVTGATCSPGT